MARHNANEIIDKLHELRAAGIINDTKSLANVLGEYHCDELRGLCVKFNCSIDNLVHKLSLVLSVESKKGRLAKNKKAMPTTSCLNFLTTKT